MRPVRVTAAAFVGALLMAPAPSEAQLGAPLEILCTSHAQEYCLAFLTYEVRQTRFDDGVVASWTSAVQLYGAAVTDRTTGFINPFTIVYSQTTLGADCPVTIAGIQTRVSGPGHYSVSDTEGGCNLPYLAGRDTSPRSPTTADIESLVFGFDDGFARCGRQWDPCVSVPEPGTWLLLVTGLLGLGCAMRRSRRHAGA